MLGAFRHAFTSLIKPRLSIARYSSGLQSYHGFDLSTKFLEPIPLLRPAASIEPAPTQLEELFADSVMRKRRLKMKKHKLRKRRKRQKAEKRKQSQGK